MREAADGPGEVHRNPSRGSPNYAVRAPLAGWLRAEAAAAAERWPESYRVLDVGCGVKPYRPFFADGVSEYVGVDVENPAADVHAPADDLPFADASFELVLCTQVLEHAEDPAQTVRELRRVTTPRGRVLASTHGVQVYHPAPLDLWRWTHSGLERLFRDNGEWSSVTVTPGAGTTACVGMVLAIYLDLLGHRARVAPLTRGLIRAVNTGAEALDRRSRRLRQPGPGTLFANFHVTAEA